MMPEANGLNANGFVEQVRAMVRAAGIENFRFDRNILVMCGVRYVVEHCHCEEPGCPGVRLRRESETSRTFTALQ